MRGTKQVGIWSEMRSFWQPHPTQDQPAPPEGFEIDSKIGAAAPRATAASKKDSRSQAMLKFHRLSSLDYRTCHRLPAYTIWFVLYAITLIDNIVVTCPVSICTFLDLANSQSDVHAVLHLKDHGVIVVILFDNLSEKSLCFVVNWPNIPTCEIHFPSFSL